MPPNSAHAQMCHKDLGPGRALLHIYAGFECQDGTSMKIPTLDVSKHAKPPQADVLQGSVGTQKLGRDLPHTCTHRRKKNGGAGEEQGQVPRRLKFLFKLLLHSE